METDLKRVAYVTDRKGHTASQGVFPGKTFDHMIGKRVELEKLLPKENESIEIERVLIIEKIYSAFSEVSVLSEEKTLQKFIRIMFMAFARASYGKGKIELAGKVSERFDEGISFVKIYSNPKIKGIRVEIHEPAEKTTRIDLTKANYAIKIKEAFERKFECVSALEFLDYENDPNDPEIEERISRGKELDQKIFRRFKPELVAKGA